VINFAHLFRACSKTLRSPFQGSPLGRRFRPRAALRSALGYSGAAPSGLLSHDLSRATFHSLRVRVRVRMRVRVAVAAVMVSAGICAAQTQEEIEAMMRATLLSGSLKGSLVSRVEKEIWRGKDPGQSVTVYKINGYELQLADLGDSTGMVGVVKDGKVVYAMQTIGAGSTPTLLYDLALGLDADGDGAPDTAIASYSGGAHCCYGYQIVNFGEEFRVGAEIDGGSGGITLENAGPQTVFRASDGVLEYWHASFAESIYSEVLISIDHDRVVLAEAWMRRDPPSAEEHAKAVAELSEAFASKEGWMQDPENNEAPFAPRALIERMVALIYGGNGKAAIALLREIWKSDAARGEAVGLDLLTRLSKSGYWDELAKLNGWIGDPQSILAMK